MRMHDKCLPCMVNQVIKVASIIDVDKKEELLRKVFTYLSKVDFETTTPEIIGEIFDMIKKHMNNPDPYKETRNYYNTLFLKLLPEFERKIEQAENSFQLAVRYAIVGNIIDFNPIHNTLLEDILDHFEKMEQLELALDDSKTLMEDISNAKIL
jgi:damage-control phosphatase, subfamily I